MPLMVTPGAMRACLGGGLGGVGVVDVGVVVVVSVDVVSVPVVPGGGDEPANAYAAAAPATPNASSITKIAVRFTGVQCIRAVGCPQTLHFAAGMALESPTWPSRHRFRPSWTSLRSTIRP